MIKTGILTHTLVDFAECDGLQPTPQIRLTSLHYIQILALNNSPQLSITGVSNFLNQLIERSKDISKILRIDNRILNQICFLSKNTTSKINEFLNVSLQSIKGNIYNGVVNTEIIPTSSQLFSDIKLFNNNGFGCAHCDYKNDSNSSYKFYA